MKLVFFALFCSLFIFSVRAQDSTAYSKYKKWIIGKWECSEMKMDGVPNSAQLANEMLEKFKIQFKRNGTMIIRINDLGDDKNEKAVYTVRSNNLIVINQSTETSRIKFIDKNTLVIYIGNGQESSRLVFSRE